MEFIPVSARSYQTREGPGQIIPIDSTNNINVGFQSDQNPLTFTQIMNGRVGEEELKKRVIGEVTTRVPFSQTLWDILGRQFYMFLCLCCCCKSSKDRRGR